MILCREIWLPSRLYSLPLSLWSHIISSCQVSPSTMETFEASSVRPNFFRVSSTASVARSSFISWCIGLAVFLSDTPCLLLSHSSVWTRRYIISLWALMLTPRRADVKSMIQLSHRWFPLADSQLACREQDLSSCITICCPSGGCSAVIGVSFMVVSARTIS